MDKKEFQVKMLLYLSCKSIEEIKKVDDALQEDMEDLEAKIQWKIGKTIRGYQVFKDGEYSFTMDDELEDADVTIIIKDVDKAKKIFKNDIDELTAIISKDLEIIGDIQLAMRCHTLFDYFLEYLKPIWPLLDNLI